MTERQTTVIIVRDRQSSGGGIFNYYSAIARYFTMRVEFSDVGKPHAFYGQGEHSSSRFTPWRLLSDWAALFWKVARFWPDLVHLNPGLDVKTLRSLRRDAVNVLIARLFRRPVLIFWRGWDNSWCGKPGFPGGNKGILSRIYRQAAAHIVLSERFKQDLERWGFKSPIYVETTVVTDDVLEAAAQSSKFDLPRGSASSTLNHPPSTNLGEVLPSSAPGVQSSEFKVQGSEFDLPRDSAPSTLNHPPSTNSGEVPPSSAPGVQGSEFNSPSPRSGPPRPSDLPRPSDGRGTEGEGWRGVRGEGRGSGEGRGEVLPFRLLFLSRVEVAKGVFELLEVYRILKQRNPAYTLTIAGDGPDLEALKVRARELGLQDIAFPGFVEGQAKLDCYRAGWIFCFLSYTEGMPNAVLEALAMGLPIISSPAGGLSDILKDKESGFFVRLREDRPPREKFDPLEVAEAVERVTQNPDLYGRMASHNARYARERFAAPKVAARLESIYTNVLAPPVAQV